MIRLEILPMVAEDLDEVMEIERRVFPSPWSRGLFLHELRIPFSRSRVARTADATHHLAGYVCWWVVGDEVSILNIAVHPDFQRSGIGRELVRLVTSDARERHAASITLEVRRDSQEAVSFYESLGFSQTGLRRNYYGRGADALIMTQFLPQDQSA